MNKELLILIATLIILSYILEVAVRKIHLSSVIFLIGLGLAFHFLTDALHLNIGNLDTTLTLVGNLSLFFIVLQGSMELRLERKKDMMILKMLILSILPMIILGMAGAWILSDVTGLGYKNALINVIPLAVISSSIAIPGASILPEKPKEEIVYESSFSDIMGLLFFNFVFRDKGNFLKDTLIFSSHLIGIFLLTIAASFFIAWLLGKLRTSIRFIPILASLILVFEIAEYFSWPALIFIFVFGIFIGNIKGFCKIKYVKWLHPENIMSQSHEFFTIVSELGFLLRSLFFLLFGFFIHPKAFVDTKAMIWSSGILLLGYTLRYIFLKAFRIRVLPNLFYAPRGLVTVLLFMYIPTHLHNDTITLSVVVQTVILSIIIMSVGSFFIKREEKEKKEKEILEREIRHHSQE